METSKSTSNGNPSTNPIRNNSNPNKISNYKVCLIILIWLFLSTSVILYNREILIGTSFTEEFKFPITLTTLHLLFQTLFTRLLAKFTNLIFITPISTNSTNSTYDLLPLNEDREVETDPIAVELKNDNLDQMDWKTWREQIVPPAALFSVSLILSNLVYLYLGTGYISMLKSLSPVAILLAAFIFRTKEFSIKLIIIVLTISFGVGLTSYGEKNFNSIGFILQLIAIIIEATRVTLIQILLSDKNMSPLKSLYYFAPVSLFINASLILPIEGFIALRSLKNLGLFTILSNGALTFCLNLSTVYLIGLSTMVLSLSKVFKDIILVTGSALILNEPFTLLQGIGFSIATFGLLWYKAS